MARTAWPSRRGARRPIVRRVARPNIGGVGRARPPTATKAPDAWNRLAPPVPAGYNELTARTPLRPITCEDFQCPHYIYGWWGGTEAVVSERTGRVIGFRETVRGWGKLEPEQRRPDWIWHEPGSECPVVHKTWDDRFDPVFFLRTGPLPERQISTSEAFDRADDGAYTAERIQKGSI